MNYHYWRGSESCVNLLANTLKIHIFTFMNLYKLGSLIKVAFWAIILLVDYTMINVFEDPIIWIWLWLLWVFLLSRWFSFFIFFYAQERFRNIAYRDRNLVDSYKMSFLFGLFSLINILLILMWVRNKVLWLILLAVFILIQCFLFIENNKPSLWR